MNRDSWITGALAAALILVLAAPFLLQPPPEERPSGARALVLVSPHNETVRFEFERAFRRWHRERFGEDADLDWRALGGTSDIVRYLDSEFGAARRAGREGIGIDVFFGGGAYDHARQAAKGNLAPCGLRRRHPDWLAESVIPAAFSGNPFYDAEDRWYGCCLSSFGICWNRDVLAACGVRQDPGRWADLADPRLFRRVALADPTKSGSINKAFEMLIQDQIAAELAARGAPLGRPQPEDLAAGWRRAFGLIRRIGGNARYFTDSASQVPMDVAQGAAAAGMCIDFYGRVESERVARAEGSDRMQYATPPGGSSISVDPIALLAGAPHREIAERFIDFCLSPEGQLLWNARVETPGGPQRYALRRLPIRRDLYTPEATRHFSDSAARPYEQGAAFEYREAWTGPLFGLIRVLIRSACLDTHPELRDAWAAILRRGGPEACPAAMQALLALPPEAEYAAALGQTAGRLNDKLAEARLAREWTLFFRDQYRRASRLAEAGHAPPPGGPGS